jgi:hypothetical protein
MKVRTQVQLDPEDHDALQKWAESRGISMSGAVRWLIREHLARRPAPDRVDGFLEAAGSVRSVRSDEGRVSEQHDTHLYGSRRRR